MANFIIDTNVIKNYCDVRLNPVNNPLKQNTTDFFSNNNQNRVFIPDLVWAEFLGVFLHKNFDIDEDQAHQWFADRTDLVDDFEEAIIDGDFQRILFWEPKPGNDIYVNAQLLVRDIEIYNYCLKDKIFKGKLERAVEKGTQTKILDGMDAVILGYAIEIAKEYKDDVCILYTGDTFLFQAFRPIYQFKKRQGDFPKNLYVMSPPWQQFPDTVMINRKNVRYNFDFSKILSQSLGTELKKLPI